jgi:NhaP-type Na+/H+ or K+/H+ antiporter
MVLIGLAALGVIIYYLVKRYLHRSQKTRQWQHRLNNLATVLLVAWIAYLLFLGIWDRLHP